MRHAAAAPRPPKVLCTRVDALYLGYRGEMRANVRQELETRLADAKAVGTAVAVSIAGHTFELNARSRPGRWILRNADGVVVFEDGDHLAGWSLSFQADAMVLATRGARSALALARDLADATLVVVLEERLRRIDLCADLEGLALDDIDPRAWVTRRRASVATYGTLATPYSERHKGEARTGFTVGKGDVVARIYDKRAELADGRREEKRMIEEHNWQNAGWDGGAPVGRVEIQLRGDALVELDGGGLRDPDRALQRIDALWSYFTRHWLRLVVLGSATRRERCATDSRWTVVQTARFKDDGAEPRDRTRRRGVVLGRLVYGAILGLATGTRALGPLPIRSARDAVNDWSDEQCRSFVAAEVRGAIDAVERPILDSLLALGPRIAAARVVEMRNARCARYARMLAAVPSVTEACDLYESEQA